LFGAGDSGVAQRVLGTAVGLLGECAAVHLDRGDRLQVLSRFGGLAAEAAAATLAAGEGAEASSGDGDGGVGAFGAVRLLEQGRSILVGQALETRTDLTDLQARDPALAGRFLVLRDLLDTPTAGIEQLGGIGTDRRDRHAVFAEYREVLERIRSVPGLDGFLLPPTERELTGQAGQGPVVVVNVAAARSDAILVTTEGWPRCR
jgi:hypothetical protein